MAVVEPPALVWAGAPVDVISLGVGRVEQLSIEARQSLVRAQVLIGAPRHFAQLAALGLTAEQVLYPTPLAGLSGLLQRRQNTRMALLASGDALFYGIGGRLIRLLGREHLRFHANLSSLQACFHRLGLPWQDARVVSLHGRPLSNLRRCLQPGALLAVLTDQHTHPRAIAAELCGQGFAPSTVWVCEAMGSAHQAVREFSAERLAAHSLPFDRLNICVVALAGANPQLPGFPGIADAAFSTGARPGFGMITKREVRLCVLSMMQPAMGETAWDIGAGCGSVSVEWARWNPSGRIYAIESRAARMAHLDINRSRFGVEQNCHPVAGTAPDCCARLPAPGCVFIGGSNGQLETLIEYAWQRLAAGGKLVVAAVTPGSSAVVSAWRDRQARGGKKPEWVEIAVSKNRPDSLATRRLMPVQLLQCSKD